MESVLEKDETIYLVSEVKQEPDLYSVSNQINENFMMENNVMNLLENEDRKCAFLKHVINNLKKQIVDMERISEEQRKYIVHQQMELEKISSAIFSQKEEMGLECSKEGLECYTNNLNMIQQMYDYMCSLKSMLNEDNDLRELEYWRNYCAQLIKRISEAKAEINELQARINQQENQDDGELLIKINSNVSLLKSKFHEYKQLMKELNDENLKIAEIQLCSKKLTLELDDLDKKFSGTLEHFQRIDEFYVGEVEKLRECADDIKKEHDKMTNEFFLDTKVLEEKFQELDHIIDTEKSKLQVIKKQRMDLLIENCQITAQNDLYKEKCSKMETIIAALTEKQEIIQTSIDTISEDIEKTRKNIEDGEYELNNLNQEFDKLNESCLDLISKHGGTNVSPNSLEDVILRMQEKLDKLRSELEIREKEKNLIENELEVLLIEENGLKYRLSINDDEHLNTFCREIGKKIEGIKQKEIDQIAYRLEEVMVNVEKINNYVMEKYFLIDALKADIKKYNDAIPELLSKIWTQNKETEDKKTKISQLKDFIAEEEKNLQTKTKLLEDLQKNTFLENEIPREWFQEFDHTRQEYEALKNQRIELEKQFNDLDISSKTEKELKKRKTEMKLSELFREESSSDLKNAAYETLKKRVLKKDQSKIVLK